MNQHHYSFKEGIKLFEDKYPLLVLRCRRNAADSFASSITVQNNKQLILTKRIDDLLLHQVYGYLILIIVLVFLCFSVFYLSSPLVKMIEALFDLITAFVIPFLEGLPEMIYKLIIDGVIGSIRTVFSFIPLIGILTLMMAVLEECGYMARIAVLMDPLMRKFNLTGKAFISLVLAIGCNVPAIVSCTSLENESSRKKTALLVPLMSCSARLPVYFFFIETFFIGKEALLLLILYTSGIAAACGISMLMKKDKTLDYSLIELPYYRIPRIHTVFSKVKWECRSFIRRTFTTVMWVLLGMWLLVHIPYGSPENSLLAQFSKAVSFLFVPLGYGQYWQLVAALIPSFIAKESMVAFLLLISDSLAFIPSSDLLSVMSFMISCLFSVPCVMSCSMIARKFGYRHMMKSILLMLLLQYICSLLFYQLFSFYHSI